MTYCDSFQSYPIFDSVILKKEKIFLKYISPSCDCYCKWKCSPSSAIKNLRVVSATLKQTLTEYIKRKIVLKCFS